MSSLSSLTIHPAACLIPALPEEDPSSLAVVASVCELGILQPLIICKSRVVDGRLRLRGAKAAGMAEVPTEEISEDDVASVILHTLAARRHLTKSAIAYLARPMLEAALAEARRRKLECLKKGQSDVSASKSPSSTPWTTGNTVQEIAANIGISRALFFEASEVIRKFESHPSLRAEWEPKILSGEMGLGQVQQAISGKIAAIEGKTTPKGDAAQLMLDLFDTAAVRFDRWGKIAPDKQEEALEKFRESFLPSLPEEFHAEYRAFLKARRGGQ